MHLARAVVANPDRDFVGPPLDHEGLTPATLTSSTETLSQAP